MDRCCLVNINLNFLMFFIFKLNDYALNHFKIRDQPYINIFS